MPTSRLDTGFWAAARMASPRGVNRKNRNSSASMTRVTAISPMSWAPNTISPMRSGLFGKGLGKGFCT